MAVDVAGNVYVADSGNNRIRLITPDGVVRTIAGTGRPGYADGPALDALFSYPHGVSVDASGNIYVADLNNHRVRQIAADGVVKTIAGNGQPGHVDGLPQIARFKGPRDVAVGADGAVYVADTDNDRIRRVPMAR